MTKKKEYKSVLADIAALPIESSRDKKLDRENYIFAVSIAREVLFQSAAGEKSK